jgi:hypothetical protein
MWQGGVESPRIYELGIYMRHIASIAGERPARDAANARWPRGGCAERGRGGTDCRERMAVCAHKYIPVA